MTPKPKSIYGSNEGTLYSNKDFQYYCNLRAQRFLSRRASHLKASTYFESGKKLGSRISPLLTPSLMHLLLKGICTICHF